MISLYAFVELVFRQMVDYLRQNSAAFVHDVPLLELSRLKLSGIAA
jgi:hypothetical protein